MSNISQRLVSPFTRHSAVIEPYTRSHSDQENVFKEFEEDCLDMPGRDQFVESFSIDKKFKIQPIQNILANVSDKLLFYIFYNFPFD